MSAVTRPRTSPVLLAHLTRLAKVASVREPATAAAVDSNAIYMGRLVAQGLVREVGKVESGKRGRPAKTYAPTDKGRKRVQRASK